jgi:hypothetical protein
MVVALVQARWVSFGSRRIQRLSAADPLPLFRCRFSSGIFVLGQPEINEAPNYFRSADAFGASYFFNFVDACLGIRIGTNGV